MTYALSAESFPTRARSTGSDWSTGSVVAQFALRTRNGRFEELSP
ncbi:MAG TPA: hypothetical protein VMD48_15070 [Solirubrobacteraceae bacterium]|nr:hypothetical protein [Solirubrobacteraceae bacterium]